MGVFNWIALIFIVVLGVFYICSQPGNVPSENEQSSSTLNKFRIFFLFLSVVFLIFNIVPACFHLDCNIKIYVWVNVCIAAIYLVFRILFFKLKNKVFSMIAKYVFLAFFLFNGFFIMSAVLYLSSAAVLVTTLILDLRTFLNTESMVASAALAAGVTEQESANAYKGFADQYSDLKTDFSKTNGKNFSHYVKDFLRLFFTYAPDDRINDISKDNIDSATVHHEKPQRDIKNDPSKMTDFDNLDPLTRESHNCADNGQKFESVEHASRRLSHSLKAKYYCSALFDFIIGSFFLGLFIQLITSLFSHFVLKKEKFSYAFCKKTLIHSCVSGLSSVSLILPFSVFLIGLRLYTHEGAQNVVQFAVGAIIVLVASSLSTPGCSEIRFFTRLLINGCNFALCCFGEYFETLVLGVGGFILSFIYILVLQIAFQAVYCFFPNTKRNVI